MSKVPVGSSPEVQQSFREVWEALDPYLRTNIDLSGRRIINAGNARAGSDYVTQQQVAGSSEFETFYEKLKERGLDGFPGRLSDPQEAVAVAYPDPPPTTHAIGQVYYDPVAGQLKIVTDAGIVVLTSGSPLTAEGGSGNVARLDGTGEFTGARTISATWTFTENLVVSNALPQITMADTTPDAADFYLKVNVDTWWVVADPGAVSIFGCTAARFDVWKPAYFSDNINVNSGAVELKDIGQVAISAVNNVWFKATASNASAGLLCISGSQTWLCYGGGTSFKIHDQTAGLTALTIAKTTGVTTLTGLTISNTAPRLTLEDTTPSADSAYLQMDANILQFNIGGTSNWGGGKDYTSLYQEASIAGSGKKLGFFAATRVSKQTVTGSREGNAALASLLTSLANYGFITNNSTAGNLGFFNSIRCGVFESSVANAEFAFYNSTYAYKGTLIQVTSNDDAGVTAGEATRYRGALWARADRYVSNYRAGVLMLEAEDGTNVYIWLSTESPKKLRMATSDPGINDTAGTVIATF